MARRAKKSNGIVGWLYAPGLLVLVAFFIVAMWPNPFSRRYKEFIAYKQVIGQAETQLSKVTETTVRQGMSCEELKTAQASFQEETQKLKDISNPLKACFAEPVDVRPSPCDYLVLLIDQRMDRIGKQELLVAELSEVRCQPPKQEVLVAPAVPAPPVTPTPALSPVPAPPQPSASAPPEIRVIYQKDKKGEYAIITNLP